MTYKLNILRPSVNNLTVRIFMRAADSMPRKPTSGGTQRGPSTWPSTRST